MRVQPEKGVLMCGPNSKKGVLGAGQVKKKGGVTAIHTYRTYSYTYSKN